MTGHSEPMLDGMPEPPPAWVRPDQGVRLPAVHLDRMLQAALPHVGTDEDLPVLAAVQVEVADGLLTTAATDRYSMIRERRPVSQTCDDFTFLLRAEDAGSLRVLLKTVLRGLKDEARDDEPVDLALEATDDGPTLRVLGQDLDIRFTEQQGEYPRHDQLLARILTGLEENPPAAFDTHVNPTLLARIVPAQRAGRVGYAFHFASADDGRKTSQAVVVRTTAEDDDLVIVVMTVSLAEVSS